MEWVGDTSHVNDARSGLIVSAGIAIALAAGWALVYGTNGTSNVYLHVMYVPVIVASLSLGILAGALTALAAGMLVGPLMPLNVELGLAQPLENTLYRAGFFLLVAVVSGGMAEVARRRFALLRDARNELSEINSRNLRLFARLVSDRDEQTGGHCERVASNAVAVGRKLGLGKDELRRFYWAGVLHDLGKLSVPEAILRKPGRLTTEEFEVIKKHPVDGERILLDISESFSDIATGVRSHHEHWDGTGYPDGLKGEAIPLIGRVLAVVDVFEAVTSHRPYRAPMTRDEALALIQAGSGSHFDPQIAAHFLELERAGLIVRENVPDPLYQEVLTGTFPAIPAHQPVS